MSMTQLALQQRRKLSSQTEALAMSAKAMAAMIPQLEQHQRLLTYYRFVEKSRVKTLTEDEVDTYNRARAWLLKELK